MLTFFSIKFAWSPKDLIIYKTYLIQVLKEIKMYCDLCNKPISANEMVRIPLRDMQQAVREGFNPFETPGIDMSASVGRASMYGMSVEQAFQGWRQQVIADTTDWGLCPMCAEAFRRATRRIPTPKGKRDYSALFESVLKSAGSSIESFVKNFEKQVTSDPDTADKFFWLGAANMICTPKDPRYLDKAIKFFEKALEIDPKHKNAYAKLLGAYMSKKDNHGVRRTAMRWAKVDPDLPQEARQWLSEQEELEKSKSTKKGIKYCPRCGSPVKEGSLFCENCGYELSKGEPKEEKPSKKVVPKMVVIIAIIAVVIISYFAFSELWEPTTTETPIQEPEGTVVQTTTPAPTTISPTTPAPPTPPYQDEKYLSWTTGTSFNLTEILESIAESANAEDWEALERNCKNLYDLAMKALDEEKQFKVSPELRSAKREFVKILNACRWAGYYGERGARNQDLDDIEKTIEYLETALGCVNKFNELVEEYNATKK